MVCIRIFKVVVLEKPGRVCKLETDKTYIVYVVENNINSKKYVGLTSLGLIPRWKRHISAAVNSKRPTHFHNAIKSYSPDAFTIRQLEGPVNKEDASVLEKFWIQTLGTVIPQYGYNLTYGGEHFSHTPETLSKISAKLVGRRLSEEHKEKLSKAKKGQPGHPRIWTAEQTAKRLLSRGPYIVSDETRLKQSESHLGKKLSEETKQKLSDVHKGKVSHYQSEESREKLRVAAKKMWESEEYRAKMKISQDARYARERAVSSANPSISG